MSKIQTKQIQSGSEGYVLTTSGGTPTWVPSSGFNGNTSGDCISDIWVTNIHSCSPLFINPNDEGNVYFGSTSAVTVDLSNNRVGIGNTSPSNFLDVSTGGLSGGFGLNIDHNVATGTGTAAGMRFRNSLSAQTLFDLTTNSSSGYPIMRLFDVNGNQSWNLAGTTNNSWLNGNLVIGNTVGNLTNRLTVKGGTTGGFSSYGIRVTDSSNNEIFRTRDAGYVEINASQISNGDFIVNGTSVTSLLRTDSSANSVGVGVASPSAKLHVRGNGSTSATNALYVDNSSSISLLDVNDDGSIIINETGLSTADVRIEGDTDTNLFFTDASTERVGIGTNSPTSKLQVIGNGSTSATNAFSVQNSSNNSFISVRDDGRILFNSAQISTGDFRVLGQTDDFLFSVDAGNDRIGVGIFGDNATAKLHLRSSTGTLLRVDDGSNEFFRITNIGAIVINDGNLNTADFTIRGDTANKLFFIDASGDRVEINTTSTTNSSVAFVARNGNNNEIFLVENGARVTINNDNISTGDFIAKGTTSNELLFVDASTNRVGINRIPSVLFEIGSNSLSEEIFRVRDSGNNPNFRMNSDGHIGVNTAPTSGVNGVGFDLRFNDGLTRTGVNIDTTGGFIGAGANSVLQITKTNPASPSQTTYGLNITVDDSAGGSGFAIRTQAGNVWFQGTSETNLFYLRDDNDRIGIGSSAPSDRLSIVGEGSTNATTALGVYNSSGQQIVRMYDDSSVVFNEQGFSTADVRIEGDTDANLFFTDASTDRIGIGSSTPSDRLSILGEGSTNATTALGVYNSSGQQIVRMYDDGQVIFNEEGLSTADVRIEGDTDTNLFFTDASTDRIGVGTNTPQNKLHVESTNEPQFRLSFNSLNYSEYSHRGYFQIYTQVPDINNFRFSQEEHGGSNIELFRHGGQNDHFRVLQGGLIISSDLTSDPYNDKLQVNVSGSSTTPNISNVAATFLNANSTENNQIIINFQNSVGNGIGNFGVVDISHTAHTSDMVWRTNNAAGFGLERMRLTSSGNFGLNTSSPTSKLDVNGTNGYEQLRLRTSYTPTSSGDTNGNVGDVAWDDNYFYQKTNTGWGRIAWDYTF